MHDYDDIAVPAAFETRDNPTQLAVKQYLNASLVTALAVLSRRWRNTRSGLGSHCRFGIEANYYIGEFSLVASQWTRLLHCHVRLSIPWPYQRRPPWWNEYSLLSRSLLEIDALALSPLSDGEPEDTDPVCLIHIRRSRCDHKGIQSRNEFRDSGAVGW